jgi:hypothetical protein
MFISIATSCYALLPNYVLLLLLIILIGTAFIVDASLLLISIIHLHYTLFTRQFRILVFI